MPQGRVSIIDLMNKLANPTMKVVLRSPLHGLVSNGVMLITVSGRRSGRQYTTPVNYVREGNTLTVFSRRNRSWWRNLRGGAKVNVCLPGNNLEAAGEVIEDHESVTAELMEYLQKVPHYARYFKVGLDPEGRPRPEDVSQAAKERVMIRLRLKK